ncbi:MAG TPA: type II toxin-antitoxin system VapC family toxin [Pyrinomonadaceae bacterium]|jgi:predicted nucleic acid-binding protein|nr:type II toxin-antitoxin system VapC family toxin [Pyrinomonadaceae bacterium]
MPSAKKSAKAAPKIERAFWDTSAIVPLCCQQDTSQEMRRIARRIKRVAAWWGTTVEARSAFSLLVRDGQMTAKGLQQAVARLEVHRASWVEVLPGDRVREIAEGLPEQYGLRALDSFQLAAALAWCKEQPRGRLFVCCDARLAEAATKAGFDVLP